MRKFSFVFITLIIGIVLGFSGRDLLPVLSHDSQITPPQDKEPLYWVAPMDPNFRRDAPGKSPMGMDLVPVFEKPQSDDATDPPGTVKISPVISNNLGVRTTNVTRTPLETEINTVGYVQFNEHNLVHVHPRVEGWIEQLFIKADGERVTEGEPIYALYSPELVNAQEEFLLAKNSGNARLIQAATGRLAALHISSEFIKALDTTQVVHQTVTFYAPQSGVIYKLNVREGYFVKPGTTLMSIGALEDIWVETEVFERQAHQLKPGQIATMSLEYLPGQTWRGELQYIYPILDAATRTVRVRLRFDNQQGLLKPNMFAHVSIDTTSSEATLVIPREAVIRTGTQDRVVQALGDGTFRSVPVKIGAVSQHNVAILHGLAEHDVVVTSAQFLIDSESSIDADLNRYTLSEAPETIQSAEVEGVINAVDLENRILNISRGAIEKWRRPPATMDFTLGRDVEITDFHPGQVIWFHFQIMEGEFVIHHWQALNSNRQPEAQP